MNTHRAAAATTRRGTHVLLAVLGAAASLLLAPLEESVRAQVPQQVGFAGRLTDLSNNTLDGTFNLTFEIFDVQTGGVALWTETQSNVSVVNGAVQTKLGSVTAIPLTVASSSSAWLQVTVGSDVLSPRQPLLSSLYAFTAGNVGGLTSAAFVTTSTVQGVNGLKTFSGGVNMTGHLTLVGSTLTVTGDQFSVGGSTLAVSAGLVGIGTATPSALLHVVGGDVVLGTHSVHGGSPLEDLHVAGNIILDGELVQHNGSGGSFEKLAVSTGLSTGELFKVGGGTLVVKADGTVGIGTQSPSSALTVIGTATANGFIGSGEGLTGITDAGLSSNIGRLASTQTASGAKTFQSTVTLTGLFLAEGVSNFGTGLDISTFSAGQLVVPGTVTAAGFVGDGSTLSGILTNPSAAKLVFTAFPSIGTSGQLGVAIDTHVFVTTGAAADQGFLSSAELKLRGRYDSNVAPVLVTQAAYDFRLRTVLEDAAGTARLSVMDNGGVQVLGVTSAGDVGIGSGVDVSTFSGGQLVVPGTVTAAGFVGDGSTLSGIVTNPMTSTLRLNVSPAITTNNQFALSMGTHVYVSTGNASNDVAFNSPRIGFRGSYDSNGGGSTNSNFLDFELRNVMAVDGSGNPTGRLRLSSVDDPTGSPATIEVLTVLHDGKVGISTGTPQETLHLVGTLRFEDGNQAAGKVLTSDANGSATWQTLAGAALTSTQTFSAANTFTSSVTVRSRGRAIILSTSTTSGVSSVFVSSRTGNVAIGTIGTDDPATTLVVGGTATANGFVGAGEGLTSLPAFAARLGSTQTFSGANTFQSSTTFTGQVTAATVTAQGFVGSGEGLTGIPTAASSTTYSGANTYTSSTTFTGQVTAATVTAQGFVGSGDGLTSLPAFASRLGSTQTFSGDNTFQSSTTFTGQVTAATVTAQGFVGSGDGLTSLPAFASRLGSTQTFTGDNTFQSSTTFTGQVTAATVTAQGFVGSGDGLTSLPAFAARLGSTQTFAGANTFTSSTTFSGRVDGTNATLAGSLTASSATFTTALLVNGHVHVTGTAPTVAADACGTTTQGTLVAGASDVRGTVTVGGDNPTTCAITFASAWTNAPVCVATRASATAAGFGATATTTVLTFESTGGIAAGQLIHYHCLGH